MKWVSCCVFGKWREQISRAQRMSRWKDDMCQSNSETSVNGSVLFTYSQQFSCFLVKLVISLNWMLVARRESINQLIWLLPTALRLCCCLTWSCSSLRMSKAANWATGMTSGGLRASTGLPLAPDLFSLWDNTLGQKAPDVFDLLPLPVTTLEWRFSLAFVDETSPAGSTEGGSCACVPRMILWSMALSCDLPRRWWTLSLWEGLDGLVLPCWVLKHR